ncbi:hypothetical protein E4K73_46580 [Streptomyces sp. IB201691-2A2]|nr:hypothetical protein E4K73_46580 [Streptomyces sp. IB201691-2A2]
MREYYLSEYRECDAVLFSDARGSMVDIVQMVGRALQLNPDQGKLATLVVPVFLGPSEDPNELLTSEALRNHGDVADDADDTVVGAQGFQDVENLED